MSVANGVDNDAPVTSATLSCLASSSYAFVGRYLPTGTNASTPLTCSEVGVFQSYNAGHSSSPFGIVLTWSTAASNQPSGWTTTNGDSDGITCKAALTGLNVPTSAGIIVYVDTEYDNALTSSQITNLGNYLSAFQSKLSGWNVGLYGQGGTGSTEMLQSICNANPWYASLPFWATNSQPTCGAAIVQFENQPQVCSYTTDTDSAVVSSYGAWVPS